MAQVQYLEGFLFVCLIRKKCSEENSFFLLLNRNSQIFWDKRNKKRKKKGKEREEQRGTGNATTKAESNGFLWESRPIRAG